MSNQNNNLNVGKAISPALEALIGIILTTICVVGIIAFNNYKKNQNYFYKNCRKESCTILSCDMTSSRSATGHGSSHNSYRVTLEFMYEGQPTHVTINNVRRSYDVNSVQTVYFLDDLSDVRLRLEKPHVISFGVLFVSVLFILFTALGLYIFYEGIRNFCKKHF